MPTRASATPPTRTEAGTSRASDDSDREHCDVERDLIELREGALGVRSPVDRDQDPDRESREQPERSERQPVDRPPSADATPIAAPAPSSHQAAMPAYERVVGAKPPFAYESAKTAAATAIPAAASRRSRLCGPHYVWFAPRPATVTAVFGGLNRLLAAAFVAGTLLVALVAPSAALVLQRRTVGRERLQGVPAGGGGHGEPRPSDRPEFREARSTPISPQTAKAHQAGRKERRALSALVRDAALRHPEPSSSRVREHAHALGSAFDLGSGPTALLVALAGTAVLLLAASGVRGWRRSHRA